MNFTPSLSSGLTQAVFVLLCDTLPPPRDDTPEARALRDQLAIAELTVLAPTDAAEATLAVRIVCAEAHARDTLRLATGAVMDPRMVLRCRAQAAMMMREADKARRMLREEREDRRKRLEDAPDPVPDVPAPPPPKPPTPEPVAETSLAGPPVGGPKVKHCPATVGMYLPIAAISAARSPVGALCSGKEGAILHAPGPASPQANRI